MHLKSEKTPSEQPRQPDRASRVRTAWLEPEDDHRSVPQGWDLSELLAAPRQTAAAGSIGEPTQEAGDSCVSDQHSPVMDQLDCEYLETDPLSHRASRVSPNREHFSRL